MTIRLGRYVVQWSRALRRVMVGYVRADGATVCVWSW
jgi:hypothetical protein